MSQTRPFRRLHTARLLARAFTLIEMLIAVGAVALIAVGMAKLFASTGQTIKTGRNISALSEAAATLERQIRKDISSIANSGDGFLVIRQKLLTESGVARAGILLSNEDRNQAPRTRRVDEFVFFAHGSYTSAREPQYPGRAPIGSAARIYYGHGMRLDGYDTLTLDADPIWRETTPPTWTSGNALGEPGPNHYAGSWTLLRHVTVLARPQRTQTTDPSAYDTSFPIYLRGLAWQDSVVQIGLQPAAASIFRFDPLHLTRPDTLGWGYKDPAAAPGGNPIAIQLPMPAQTELARPNDANWGRNRWPSFTGGMVDVAAVDLNTIRARVMSVGRDPVAPNIPNLMPGDKYFGSSLPIVFQTTPTGQLLNPNILINTVHGQKMTMASAFPSNDQWLFASGQVAPPDQGRAGNTPTAYHEQRVVYAQNPPDFTGNLSPAHTGTSHPANEPYHRQDQAMLGASVLTPGCTEFIVEWSFGDVHAAPLATPNVPGSGGIVWHGLSRKDGTPFGVRPYRAIPSNVAGQISDEYFNPGSNRPVPAGLIHWPVQQNYTAAFPVDEQIPLYSFFGYQDPTYTPADVQRDPATLEWPWPRLIRITYTLTDPTDPATEQTYQFVVQVPAQQRRPS